ncbi:MAG: hypothetical protein AAFZ07_13855 [Actinomycetota bacterium]
MTVRIEFTVEPFDDGRPGPHVEAAIAAARSVSGVEVGPFGTSLLGPTALAMAALQGATVAAFGAGATRVSSQVVREETRP